MLLLYRKQNNPHNVLKRILLKLNSSPHDCDRLLEIADCHVTKYNIYGFGEKLVSSVRLKSPKAYQTGRGEMGEVLDPLTSGKSSHF